MSSQWRSCCCVLYIVTLNLAWRGNIVKYILFSVSSFSGVVYPVMTVEGSQLCEPAIVGNWPYRTSRNEGMRSDFLVAV